MDYFGIPKGRNIKIQKFIFGPYLPVLKNMGALCDREHSFQTSILYVRIDKFFFECEKFRQINLQHSLKNRVKHKLAEFLLKNREGLISTMRFHGKW